MALSNAVQWPKYLQLFRHGDRITEALNYTFIKYKYKDDIQYLSSSKDKLVKSLDLAGLAC